MLDLNYERRSPKREWPWTGATGKQKLAFHAGGVFGASLPFLVLLVATQFSTYTPADAGGIPQRNWADKLLTFGLIGSFLPCVSCPLGLGLMAGGYFGVGYSVAFIVALIERHDWQ